MQIIFFIMFLEIQGTVNFNEHFQDLQIHLLFAYSLKYEYFIIKLNVAVYVVYKSFLKNS